MKQVYIDMDGVLVDTIAHECKRHNFDMSKWIRGEYNINLVTGIEADDFFRDTDWTKLPRTDLAYSILYYAWEKYPNNCFILTSALPGAFDAKVQWMKEVFPFVPESNIIFTWRKYLLAREDRILIEDNEDVAHQWIKNGGQAIVMPQPWNWSNTDVMEALRSYE